MIQASQRVDLVEAARCDRGMVVSWHFFTAIPRQFSRGFWLWAHPVEWWCVEVQENTSQPVRFLNTQAELRTVWTSRDWRWHFSPRATEPAMTDP
jgi:hypothetical protein